MLDLQTQINELASRLNVIDGNGLAAPAVGAIANLNGRINGVQSDIQSSILMMESIINQYQTQVASYINLWQQRFGPAPAGLGAPLAGTPTGTIDGANTAFTLPYAPVLLLLFKNNGFLIPGVDYTTSGANITFTVAPTTGSVLSFVLLY